MAMAITNHLSKCAFDAHTRTISVTPQCSNSASFAYRPKLPTITRTSVSVRPRRSISIQATSFGSRLEGGVKRAVTENSVVIYSKTWCSYCSEVKSLFRRLGVEPLVIELDEMGAQGPQLRRVLERLTGQFTVPNVFIGGKHVGGCTDTMKLHKNGELEPLLSEASARAKQNQPSA